MKKREDPFSASPSSSHEEQQLKTLLLRSKVIAVVGLSDKPERPSYKVATYLKEHGYKIIPINPRLRAWKGIPALPSMEALESADIVVVFRKPSAVPEIAEKARGKCKALWLQPGAENEKAEALFGGMVIKGRCIMQEHKRLIQRR